MAQERTNTSVKRWNAPFHSTESILFCPLSVENKSSSVPFTQSSLWIEKRAGSCLESRTFARRHCSLQGHFTDLSKRPCLLKFPLADEKCTRFSLFSTLDCLKKMRFYFNTAFLCFFVLIKELKILSGINLHYSPERHAKTADLENGGTDV